MRLLSFVLAGSICFFTPAANACGNEYATPMMEVPANANKINLWALTGGDFPYFTIGTTPGAKVQLVRMLRDLESKTGLPINGSLVRYIEKLGTVRELDYRLLSDLAWYGLKAGRNKESLELLEKLYQKFPHEYNIVANLGTAYEVNGDNVNALKYIREAVALNPASHRGSEWIHVNILEHKVANAASFNSIIDLSRKRDASGKFTASRTHPAIHPDSLIVQLAYQLHERMGFISPPDPIISQLIHDFAILVEEQHDANSARPFFDLAKTYQPEDKAIEITTDTTAAQRSGTLNNSSNWTSRNSTLLVVGALTVIIILVYFIRRVRRQEP